MLSPLACRLLDPQPTGVGIETRDMFEEPFVHPGQIVFVGSRAGVRTEDRTDEPLGLAREGFHRSTTSLITEVRKAQVVPGDEEFAPGGFGFGRKVHRVLQRQQGLDESSFIERDIRVGGLQTPRGGC